MNESDRRARRTRELLIHALLELIETRHYDQISVQDIVERADVGRSTFYAHYENKDALLMGGFEHLLEMLVQQIQCDSTGQLTFETVMLFQHARGHYEIYRTLLWGTGFELLIKDGHTALSEKIETRLRELRFAADESLVPLAVLACSLAGSLLVLLKWWLDNKMPYPPERMNEIFQQLAMTGVQKGATLP
jgi:AcrR family transcriptional regulator